MLYLFIKTDNEAYLKRMSLLQGRLDAKSNDSLFCSKIIFEKGDSKYLFKCGINLFDDSIYSNIPTEYNESVESHRLISYSYFTKSKFFAKTDRLGIFAHYYFFDKNSFISSNNPIIISYIVDSGYNMESIYELLFFKKPFRKKSWYNDIYRLEASEFLEYDLLSNEIRIDNYYNFSQILEVTDETGYADAFSEFFSNGKKNILDNESKKITVSLSAGVDSRAVLSGISSFTNNFTTASWGGEKYYETFLIKNVAKKLNLDLKLIEFDKLIENYNHYLYNSFFLSGGLFPAIHYYYYYSHFKSGDCLFEGYGGSEMVKGELSNGMVNDFLVDCLKCNVSYPDAIEKHFAPFNKIAKKEMTEYFDDLYSDYFCDVNSELGFNNLKKYILEFIPSRIFGGVFQPAVYSGLHLFEPFFSIKFLKALYGSGNGIAKNISLRSDYPNSLTILKDHYHFTKNLDFKVNNTMLDRGVKLSEAGLPYPYLKLLNKIRYYKNGKYRRKYEIKSQVDYDKINLLVEKDIRKINPFIENIIENDNLVKSDKNIEYLSFYLNILDRFKSTNFLKQFIDNQLW